jgi:LDH2 family malate/lactate/ureidoglycolate dehydrogenase
VLGWLLNKDGLPSTDPTHTKKPQGNNIGHCFIAIDPGLFRKREEFTADVTRLCDDLRATKPVDPAQPVMVAGDPQWHHAERRMRDGISVGPGLLNQIRQIAQACAAPWLLD